jgi:hypothetical protein
VLKSANSNNGLISNGCSIIIIITMYYYLGWCMRKGILKFSLFIGNVKTNPACMLCLSSCYPKGVVFTYGEVVGKWGE